ncbi:MAG: hypothetical protein P9M15_03335 [Candidatus Electryoneaceae bacterium]|nr:hypothetical protein [Candidatus Electryoneaceae bacterium]
MITLNKVFPPIPEKLRETLLEEYNSLIQSYMEGRWGEAELSGGKFCEIVYTILEGYSSGVYNDTPQKPRNFVDACRRLENDTNNPRSFQILIPRMLPAIYEIRNNRGVGHVGGDVNPNHMDATAIVSLTSWIMAELVRVYYECSTNEAQGIVDSIVERRIPLVWQSGEMKRVLNTNLSIKDNILVLIASCFNGASIDDLIYWIEPKDPAYLRKVLRSLHAKRYVEFSQKTQTAVILPPGSDYVTKLIRKLKN